MAERIIRQLIDDLDGTEIAEGGGEQIEFSGSSGNGVQVRAADIRARRSCR